MFEVPLNGALAFIFIAAVPIAFLLNLFVQALYRRAVQRAMRVTSSAGPDTFAVPDRLPPNPGQLRVSTEKAPADSPLRLGLAIRYLVAGLAYGLIEMAVLFVLEDVEFAVRRSLIVAAVLATPAIPFCIHVAGARRLLVWLGTAAWIGLLALIEPATPTLVAIQVGPVALVALILANRLFRATSLTLYLIALALIIPLLFALDLALVLVPALVGGALYAAVAILLCVGLLSSWIMARLVARVSVGASDLMLQNHALWFMMTLWQIALLSSTQGSMAFWAVLSFLGQGLVLFVTSRLNQQSEAPLMLFLRVFGQRKVQQSSTHGAMTDWRMTGPVMLIGAGDLATETLDTDELAAFLSAATARLFITSPDDLERALRRNASPAHDGLYPVLDYYCQDNTWRPVVQTLMNRASQVLLDLRGFDKDNLGVQYEIGELVRRVPLETLTVLVDGTTDVELAQKLFRQEWSDAHGNGTAGDVTLRFEEVAA